MQIAHIFNEIDFKNKNNIYYEPIEFDVDYIENIINKKFPKYYNTGITVIGEYSTIPQNTIIGKNVMIDTKIKETDFKTKIIESGESVINEN